VANVGSAAQAASRVAPAAADNRQKRPMKKVLQKRRSGAHAYLLAYTFISMHTLSILYKKITK
jgi:hypothetical protein